MLNEEKQTFSGAHCLRTKRIGPIDMADESKQTQQGWERSHRVPDLLWNRKNILYENAKNCKTDAHAYTLRK